MTGRSGRRSVLCSGLIATLVASLHLPVAAQPAFPTEPAPTFHSTRFVIELAPGTPRPRLAGPVRPDVAPSSLRSTGMAALDAMNARHRPIVYEPMFPTAAPADDLSRFYVVELPATASLSAALADYASVSGVAGAERIPLVPLSFVPNDPSLSQQWQLGQPNDHDSDVFEAWDITLGDSSIVVAILDTGVLYSHDDLGGSAAPHTAGNIAMNWIEMAGVPGVDDDSNGYVDDFRGWDFVASGSGVAGEDLSMPDNDPRDFAGHGTFCAGMASARTDNGVGIAGTGFRTRILPLRVGWKDAPSSPGQIDIGLCAQAIRYAVDNGAKVINCSWQSFAHSALNAAVNDAVARAATLCVAAGNSNSGFPNQNYLGQRGDCVDVAGIDRNDLKVGFSNYGNWVEVSAAASGVTSTWSTQYAPGYLTSGGTSVAAPMVAGAIALYQAYRQSLGLPLEKPGRIALRVRDTGDDLDVLNPTYAGKLGGRLNVHRLLTDPPTSWSNAGGAAFRVSPVLADLDDDGDEEVVLGDGNGRVIAVTGADGDTIPGFPVVLDGAIVASPALWDLDRDGRPEIVTGTNTGSLYAIRGDGSIVPGYPVSLGGALAGPAIADIDRTHAGLELAIGSADGRLWVLDAAGSARPGWPKQLGGVITATPALHDFDGDGGAEVTVGDENGTLHGLRGDGTAMSGWPVTLPAAIQSSAAIGDVDRDGIADVVVGCFDHHLHGFKRDGTAMAGWPASVPGVTGSPALADVSGDDGFVEVVIASNDLRLFVLDHTGTPLPGWPQWVGSLMKESVAIADVDADQRLDLVVGSNDGNLHIFTATGAPKAGWPRPFSGALSGTPSIGDPDHDGRAEIVIGTEAGRLHAIDMGPGTWDPGRAPWPTMHRDYFRRGSLSDPPVVGVAPGAPGAGAPRITLRAVPNPSTAGARLVVTRTGSVLDVPGAIDIYAVTGQHVRHLPLPANGAGEITTVWDGTSDLGRHLPAGIYVASVRWNGLETRQRIVRLPGGR